MCCSTLGCSAKKPANCIVLLLLVVQKTGSGVLTKQEAGLLLTYHSRRDEDGCAEVLGAGVVGPCLEALDSSTALTADKSTAAGAADLVVRRKQASHTPHEQKTSCCLLLLLLLLRLQDCCCPCVPTRRAGSRWRKAKSAGQTGQAAVRCCVAAWSTLTPPHGLSWPCWPP
jgi:hypothetical protein